MIPIIDKNLNDILIQDVEFLGENEIKENQFLEYKGKGILPYINPKKDWNAFYENIAKKVAGLANTRGGKIIFGVSEKNNIAQEPTYFDPNKLENKLPTLFLTYLQPYIQYEVKKLDNPKGEGQVLLLEIKKTNCPIIINNGSDKGRFFIRVNEDTKIADLYEVQMLFERKSDKNYLEKVANEVFLVLAKYCNQDDKKINNKLRNNMKSGLIAQYKKMLPKLFIIPKENDKLETLILDSRYRMNNFQIKDELSNESYYLAISRLLKKWYEVYQIIIDYSIMKDYDRTLYDKLNMMVPYKF